MTDKIAWLDQYDAATQDFEAAKQGFESAATSCIEDMRLGIIREFPEKYSQRECAEAGVRWFHPLRWVRF